jgi:hypothetical protein
MSVMTGQEKSSKYTLPEFMLTTGILQERYTCAYWIRIAGVIRIRVCANVDMDKD